MRRWREYRRLSVVSEGMKRKGLVGMCVLATLLVGSISTVAWAWGSFKSVNVKAAGMSFTGVALSAANKGAARCTLTVKVTTSAPDTKARELSLTVTTDSGKSATGRVSHRPAKAGRGHVTFRQDTSADGCWAAKVQRPARLSARGCIGKGCSP